MSFVDLMAEHDWSEGDILAYTEQHVRNGFGVEEIPILRDKLLGQMLGTRVLTADEQADMARYEARKLDAGTLAQAARDDMALLRQAWSVEAAQLRLARDPVASEADGSNQAAVDMDAADRATAQQVIAAAPQSVLDLVAKRAAARPVLAPALDPVPEPTPEPQS
jgi:hypothetical protein